MYPLIKPINDICNCYVYRERSADLFKSPLGEGPSFRVIAVQIGHQIRQTLPEGLQLNFELLARGLRSTQTQSWEQVVQEGTSKLAVAWIHLYMHTREVLVHVRLVLIDRMVCSLH